MIRLIVVDDHRAIAKGLGELIEGTPNVTVVGTAHDLTSARALIERTSPDVVLCDIELLNADDGLVLLAEHSARVLFIMLSAHTRPNDVVTAIGRGARGYLSKMAGIEEIVAAVRTVADGGSAFPDDAREAIRMSLPPPTPKELALLQLLAEGHSYAEIAGHLSLGVRTVESYLQRLFARYGVANRVALVRLAQRQGWIDEGR